MKSIKIIFVIFLWTNFSGCSIGSNFFIINISQSPLRISYQLHSLNGFGYFENTAEKYKVVRDEEAYSIGMKDTSFISASKDSIYEFILYQNEALKTGSSSYSDILKDTEKCAFDFKNLKYLSIVKIDSVDSTGRANDSLYITANMMCSVIEEIDKSYAFVIR